MQILKKENWWIWLLLLLFSSGSSPLVLGALLNVYNKNSWYKKWYYWVIGLLFLILPFIIMTSVFYLQILSLSATKLKVKGKEIYLSPYIWILALIIPFIGWFYIVGMTIYLNIAIIIKLKQGNGEKYINA